MCMWTRCYRSAAVQKEKHSKRMSVAQVPDLAEMKALVSAKNLLAKQPSAKDLAKKKAEKAK